ncbi:MAG: hypothetical protein F6K48_22750 [Okeania sp. SIO3H1]|uniref:hypothetical protein n=1 Tax=Okeania sp. SIO1I7 TaxID=2607772 RepID=UPI0013C8C98A|nr:hypothetical protein [Okeania sp. SIO1I7]NEN91569.1 hypothetical protein [Okeania sp. SIO3H1]NET30343.1 hypothetical protein [Okeania sp. SIO1I7]
MLPVSEPLLSFGDGATPVNVLAATVSAVGSDSCGSLSSFSNSLISVSVAGVESLNGLKCDLLHIVGSVSPFMSIARSSAWGSFSP